MNHIPESPASLFSIGTCPYMLGLLEQLYRVLQHRRLWDLHRARSLPFRSWCRSADWHGCLHMWHPALLQEHRNTRRWSPFRSAWVESRLRCYKLDVQTSDFQAYFGSVGLKHVPRWWTKLRYTDRYPRPALQSTCLQPMCLRTVPGSHPLPGFPRRLHGIGYHRVTEIRGRLGDMDQDGHAFCLYYELINRCPSYEEQDLSLKNPLTVGSSCCAGKSFPHVSEVCWFPCCSSYTVYT